MTTQAITITGLATLNPINVAAAWQIIESRIKRLPPSQPTAQCRWSFDDPNSDVLKPVASEDKPIRDKICQMTPEQADAWLQEMGFPM